MQEKEGCEVIRFVERGEKCYASTDYLNGYTLYRWVNENQKIEKELLLVWIREILKQLSLFHKQQGNPDYQFLNPYNIVIVGKHKILLMSVEEAEKNLDEFVEKYFTPSDKKQNKDVYCFGKIIQFIMAHIQCEPYLTKREEYQLLKIVRKCLEANRKNQYESIQMIQNNFIKGKKKERRFPKWKYSRKSGIIIAAIMIFMLGYFIRREGNRITVKPTKIIEAEMAHTEKDTSEYFDIGLSYFLEVKNYEKSYECFEKAEGQVRKAKYYKELAGFMLDNSLDMDTESVLKVLKMQIGQENERDVREILILIRVYALFDTEEAYQSMIELEKMPDIERQWDSLEEALQKEFYEYEALAYEKLQFWDRAIASYKTLLEVEMGEEEREQIYLKLIGSYKEMNDTQEVAKLCKKGMEELTKSVEICISYIENLWADQSLDEAARLGETQRIIEEKPEITKDEAFLRLMKTKGIQVEGERIWVEE